MDIFTILVFFLLVNSSSDQQLPSSSVLSLPESASETVPQETLRVIVTEHDVLVEGRPVVKVEALMAANTEFSTELKEELSYRRSLSRDSSALLRSEEHTSELQSRGHLVCRLLLEKKKRSEGPASV